FPEKFQHFSTDYSSGHPTLADGGTTLYFVSNNPLGKGSTDIWVTHLDTIANKWTKPALVGGEINTLYDEMFPSYVEGKGLYFSSNGHLGYGGFDIYFAKKTYDGFAAPVSLEEPFNSNADDFSYTPLTETTGVFASNRIGGVGGDDLYYFYFHAVKLEASGVVVDKNYKPLPNVIVVVENEAQGIADTLITDEQGKYTYLFMEPNNEYRVKAFKSGYFVPVPEYRTVSTLGMNQDMMIDSVHGYDLNFVLDEMIKDKEYKIENIYYDLDKYDLRPESIAELDKIVALLKSNPEIAIQINSHTDDRASGEYNRVLSNNRAKSVVDYLVSQGISPTRLAWQGWGKTALIYKHAHTEEEHQANRRTTFNIVNFDELQLGEKAIFHQDLVNRLRGGAYIPPATTGVYFRLQLNSSRSECKDAGFAKFREAFPTQDSYCSQFADGYYRYLAGRFSTFEEAEAMKQKVDELGYNSMILAYNNYERVSVNEALRILRENQPLVPDEEVSEEFTEQGEEEIEN
ncbi:MAG: OmpA family protein, partial [Bacteroidales bacterium]|nr:OmpA family protein [Bacteroidales bacterium]